MSYLHELFLLHPCSAYCGYCQRLSYCMNAEAQNRMSGSAMLASDCLMFFADASIVVWKWYHFHHNSPVCRL